IEARDGLAFAYENNANFSRLLIFAVDEGARVYWFHPEWGSPSANPVVIEIEGGPARHELPMAIHHTFEGREIKIYGVFTRRSWTVREVEDRIRTGAKVPT